MTFTLHCRLNGAVSITPLLARNATVFKHGFGVLTKINVKTTMKGGRGRFDEDVIFRARDMLMAYEAKLEPKVGALPPAT